MGDIPVWVPVSAALQQVSWRTTLTFRWGACWPGVHHASDVSSCPESRSDTKKLSFFALVGKRCGTVLRWGQGNCVTPSQALLLSTHDLEIREHSAPAHFEVQVDNFA
jgi:hypothetical protein